MKSSSDSSSLSSAPPSEVEEPKKPTLKLSKGKLTFSRKNALPEPDPEPDPSQLGRDPSPPHEYVLADNPDIAFIVMFRSRFSDVFSKNVPNLGPQDLENGAVSLTPTEQIENLLCALLSLLLNRKKNVERGHHSRALEDAISSHKHQWPPEWASKNPLSGTKSFESLDPAGRLNLLRTLIVWALNTSEAIIATIKDSYKQSRHDDDLNQPLFVPPWGTDTLKRNHYLIEGQHDTGFRIYREEKYKNAAPSWFSVAGSIEEAQKLARNLRAESGQAAHRLANRITQAIPLLEQREDKRKRKEYRQQRKANFKRPDPGFSLYEGRTRGKRMCYTYEEDDGSGTEISNRRSMRQSGTSTPAEQGPTFTASGRQVRSRFGKSFGEASNADGNARGSSHLEDDGEEDELSRPTQAPRGDGRPRRSGRSQINGAGRHIAGYNSVDEMDEESDAASSSNGWDGDDNDFEGTLDEDEDEDVSDDGDADDDSLGEETRGRSLVVQLKYSKTAAERVAGLASDPASMRDSSPDPLHQGHDPATPQKQQQQQQQQPVPLRDSPYKVASPATMPAAQQPAKPPPTKTFGQYAYQAPASSAPPLNATTKPCPPSPYQSFQKPAPSHAASAAPPPAPHPEHRAPHFGSDILNPVNSAEPAPLANAAPVLTPSSPSQHPPPSHTAQQLAAPLSPPTAPPAGPQNGSTHQPLPAKPAPAASNAGGAAAASAPQTAVQPAAVNGSAPAPPAGAHPLPEGGASPS